MTPEVHAQLAAIRDEMVAAAKAKDVPAFKAAGARHRAILHANNPAIGAIWRAQGNTEAKVRATKTRFT